jgi:hypothetical protein
MKKRGIRFIFLILFSLLLIISFSDFIRAPCGPNPTLSCNWITMDVECEYAYPDVCTWTGSSCVNQPGKTCNALDNDIYENECRPDIGCQWEGQPSCGSGGCCIGGHIAMAGAVCQTLNAYWNCVGNMIFVNSQVLECDGNSATCGGNPVIILDAYENCITHGGCNTEAYWPTLCRCVSWSSFSQPGARCAGGGPCMGDGGSMGCCDAMGETCATKGYVCGDWHLCGADINCGSCGVGYNCNTLGKCVLACSDIGAGCSTGSSCCSPGYCVAGVCASGCGSNGAMCSTTTANYNSYGICASSTCDTSLAGLSAGTYYSSCSGVPNNAVADGDSLAGGFSQNGICCSSSFMSSGTLSSDVNNCGSCGNVCSSNHGTSSCSGGTCSISCSGGWGNCNGLVSDGCEQTLTTLTHCGACNNPCSLAHATASCATGSCQIGSCDSGWLNCDGGPANGCEQSTSVTNGVLTSCSNVNCNPGYGNCDGNYLNGCERSLNTLTDCGNCNVACSLANAAESCASGSCVVTGCNGGWGNCNGVQSDGCEKSLNTLTDCGNCNVACSRTNAVATCSTGSCAIQSCNGGYDNCDGSDSNGCETSLNTLANCRWCGDTCNLANVGESCATGSCQISGSCNGGWGNCNGLTPDGCERSLTTLADCGGCGTSCNLAHATESCATGSCTITSCDAGWDDCDGQDWNGCEININNNVNNCGLCEYNCVYYSHITGLTCTAGECAVTTCEAGYDNCDGDFNTGCETYIKDVNNCGSCGNSCHDGIGCTTDICNTNVCVNNYPACSMSSDGCCSPGCNVGNDADCTSCTQDSQCNDGNSCTQNRCSGGSCTFPPVDCNDLNSCTTDSCSGGICSNAPLNCGDGNACTADSCNAGSCVHSTIDCNDWDACTAPDTCFGGTCSNPPINCGDGNACTTDYCNAGSCFHPAITCNDFNSCTTDTCNIASGCIFTPFACANNDGCCPAGCNIGNDNDCTSCTQNSQCNDSNPCTTNTCSGGTCTYPPIVSCTGGDSCCPTGCNISTDSDCSCTPNCAGKSCGSDGCLGNCGTCPSGICNTTGQCVVSCIPNCVGKVCGTDGCLGNCGTCSNPLLPVCNAAGQCVAACTDTCVSLGYECGTHTICSVNVTCGNYSGGCPTGETCNIPTGQCVTNCTDTCASLGYECGTHTICGVSTTCGSYSGGCPTGETCNIPTGQCVVSSCDLTSASWDVTSTLVGNVVMLNVGGTNCDGKTILFEVREDDGIFADDNVLHNPTPIVYGSPSRYGIWAAEWMDDTDHIGQKDPPEYYFFASVQGTSESIESSKTTVNMLKVLTGTLECIGFNYCSGYRTEADCTSDLCDVGQDSIPSTFECAVEYNCGCYWTSSTEMCNPYWDGINTLKGDMDEDLILNGDDPDFDGNTILDIPFATINALGDIDSDGILNINDRDMDAHIALNGDDPDFDNDGNLDPPFNSINANGDIDLDGILNVDDPDMDGDSIFNGDDPDFDDDNALDYPYDVGVIFNGDIDLDGIINIDDSDMDGDSVLNGDDPDFNNDGILDGRYALIADDSKIGTCNYTEVGADTCEDDGSLTRTLTAVWSWGPLNPTHFDPMDKEGKCQTINDVILCPASAQVKFFGAWQLIIVIAIVALIYLIYALKKKNKAKKTGKKIRKKSRR